MKSSTEIGRFRANVAGFGPSLARARQTRSKLGRNCRDRPEPAPNPENRAKVATELAKAGRVWPQSAKLVRVWPADGNHVDTANHIGTSTGARYLGPFLRPLGTLVCAAGVVRMLHLGVCHACVHSCDDNAAERCIRKPRPSRRRAMRAPQGERVCAPPGSGKALLKDLVGERGRIARARRRKEVLRRPTPQPTQRRRKKEAPTYAHQDTHIARDAGKKADNHLARSRRPLSRAGEGACWHAHSRIAARKRTDDRSCQPRTPFTVCKKQCCCFLFSRRTIFPK